MKLPITTQTPKVCRLASMLVLMATVAAAQMRHLDTTCVVRGLVRAEGGPGATYTVELRGDAVSGFPLEGFVDPNGSFQIHGVRPGQYVLVVKGDRGAVVHQEFINAGPNMGEVWIQLPARKTDRPVGGTVSAKALQHKVPSKAAKEFARSIKAAEKGDTQTAIEHLEKAIQIDPDYMEAHNNLGSQYIQVDKYDQALAHLQKACELDPGASMPQVNLATVLLMRKDFAAAETAARRALDLDPRLSGARFTLAISLLELNKEIDEAIQQLQRIADDIPRAHIVLARFYEAQGDKEKAGSELKLYLAKASPAERQELQTWLAKFEPPKP